MENKLKRILIFLFGCFLTRLSLVFIAKYISKDRLPYLGYLTLIPMFGFFIIYIFGLRKTGGEVFGDKIWWNSLRPLHGILYMVFAILAIKGNQHSYKILLLDVFIGLVSFLGYHFIDKY